MDIWALLLNLLGWMLFVFLVLFIVLVLIGVIRAIIKAVRKQRIAKRGKDVNSI